MLAKGDWHVLIQKETFMQLNRMFTRFLVLAALALGILTALPASAASVYLEGVVIAGDEPGCVVVRDSQGNAFILEGTGWYGVLGNDYVRLQGTMVPENRCGAQNGIQVASVETIWRDNSRKVIVYERTKEGRFEEWVRAHRDREWREWERQHHIPPPPPQQ
jgi:hypothetical protein